VLPSGEHFFFWGVQVGEGLMATSGNSLGEVDLHGAVVFDVGGGLLRFEERSLDREHGVGSGVFVFGSRALFE
jgi:hypothetical protein